MKYIIDTNNFPLSDYTKWVHDNATPLTDCTDAISREEVKELLEEYYAELTLDETALKSNAIAIKVTRHIINDIEALPSVNPTTDLSKMRAEIEKVPTVKPCPPYINEFAEEEHYNSKSAGMIKDDILKIIDKYIVKE